MAKVKIITDSVSDLPLETARALNIDVVPLYVNIKGESKKDRIEITLEELNKFMETCADDEIPQTSHPSIQDYQEFFEKAAQVSKEIIIICATARLSKAYEHAVIAARDFSKARIEVIDTGFGAGGEGLIAIEAAKRALSGENIEQILEAVERSKDRIELIGALETLKYLEKGGRIGKAQALLGSLLSIKPIISLKNGEVIPLGKVRTREKGLEFIINKMRAKITELKSSRIRLFIETGNDPEWSKRLRQILTKEFSVEESWESGITPVIGTHTGPGVWIVCYHVL